MESYKWFVTCTTLALYMLIALTVGAVFEIKACWVIIEFILTFILFLGMVFVSWLCLVGLLNLGTYTLSLWRKNDGDK